jgi:putative membrane protein
MRTMRMSTVMAALLLVMARFGFAQQGAPPAAPTQQPTAQSQTEPSNQANNMEAEVLSKMHQANQMEIKGGELAKSKAADAHVRNYADLLVKDHKVADKMIQDLARKQGITLTEPMPKTDEEKSQMEMQKQAMAELESLSGPEFDRKFLAINKQAHDMAVQMTTTAAQQLKPGPVQMLVSRMVPILKQHDTLAEHLGQRETAQK